MRHKLMGVQLVGYREQGKDRRTEYQNRTPPLEPRLGYELPFGGSQAPELAGVPHGIGICHGAQQT